MLTLTHEPYDEPVVEYVPRIIVSTLGAENEQRQKDGINTNLQKWTFRYSNKEGDYIQAAYDFFKSHRGYQAFEWTPPKELTPRKFVCEEFSMVYDHYTRVRSLTAVLLEVPL